jgi:hypothetical protein
MNSVVIALEIVNSQIALVINGKVHHLENTLFEYQVEIDTDDSSVIQFIDDLLYDG